MLGKEGINASSSEGVEGNKALTLYFISHYIFRKPGIQMLAPQLLDLLHFLLLSVILCVLCGNPLPPLRSWRLCVSPSSLP